MFTFKDLLTTKERTIPLSETFSQYVTDNTSMLSGLSVIATITAIFLNIDSTRFSNLKSLQLFLLLFLVLSLVFVLINTAGWLIQKSDSVFSSIILLTQMLFIFQLCKFIIANFGSELKSYLAFIYITAIYAIWSVLRKLQKKYESELDKKESRHNQMIGSVIAVAFMYTWLAGTNVFRHFSKDLSINWMDFIDPFLNPMQVAFFAWILVVGIAFSYGDSMQKHSTIWRAILFSPAIFFAAWVCMEVTFVTTGVGI